MTLAYASELTVEPDEDLGTRYGGEAFVVLRPKTVIDGVLHVAALIHQKPSSSIASKPHLSIS
ncbi:hypothetical protein H6F86_04000 [Phormidium sp. FACHB-592]|uniref:GGDEF domain-containing protein n=1 Tax=Stenomitos frigidus AS-A4 TaxID=2933935 RepID=A0ABV0KUC7_9CYAN|nr:hypothetical protein [Phormidium sp. FACHB-592]MBD2073062.1 hypothetical protein [Phormidium sp. FACHB-592]